MLVGGGIALAIGLGGGSSKTANVPPVGSLTNALPNAADVHRLFKGIPQNGNVLGAPSAPVTIVEYVDLQCPYCQQFDTQALPSLVASYIRPGKAKLEVRLLAFIGADSVRGRSAAIAAGKQNRLFDFVDLLYFNQATENTGWLDDAMVQAAAASIPGLRVPAIMTESSSAAIAAEAKAFDTEAKAAAVTSTPTILVGSTAANATSVALSSPTDGAAVAQAVRSLLP
ncbi:MAG: thioredoxin domain-containing protein [Actinomycetes bacterium]